MPSGPGTYGSKVGRPPSKKKKPKSMSVTKTTKTVGFKGGGMVPASYKDNYGHGGSVTKSPRKGGSRAAGRAQVKGFDFDGVF